MSLFDFVFVLKSLATLQSFLTEISSFDVWICSRSSIHFTCNASDKPSSSSQQEKKKNGVFFDSISQFNFFFVCLWQIVPFLSITTTGPMGTKVEIYIRLQFEKSKHVCVQNLFFLLPHLLPAACFNLVPTFTTGVILYDMTVRLWNYPYELANTMLIG